MVILACKVLLFHYSLNPTCLFLVWFFNKLYRNNQKMQLKLVLGKTWDVPNPYLRLITTIFGMVVNDVCKAYHYSISIRKKENILGIRVFLNISMGIWTTHSKKFRQMMCWGNYHLGGGLLVGDMDLLTGYGRSYNSNYLWLIVIDTVYINLSSKSLS